MSALQFFDTHCHIHEILKNAGGDGETNSRWHKADITNPDDVIQNAISEGVTRMVCVGTSVEDSELAVDFVQERAATWASIGIHPHEAKRYVEDTEALQTFADLATKPKVVAVGECGLDFYYTHSPRADQIKILEFQLDIAQKNDLPLIFHVRDAFDDFWPIFDNFQGLRGVIHSFTANTPVLEQIMTRDLYVGLNGIMTFTKDGQQLEAAKAVPLDKLVLETDAPFLTPVPFRGRICVPKHVRVTAEFLSTLRQEPLAELARASTANALTLFRI
ncbi:MAG: sec-independent protein translocase protein [Candidatus Saccharibacteria bacterium]|nr:sec-independent protein translocase protein [Candidatus Saccharibacteria bacterium]